MKIFALSLSILVLSVTAFAGPKVGDSATLDGTLVGDGINARVSTVQKIIAFNANTAVYTVQQTQTIAGQAQTREENVAADDILTEENAAQIVQYCESQSIGQKERVTVAAGAFDTCRVTGDNGAMIWVGRIPFGIVKMQSKISVGTISLGAADYTRGL